MPALKKLVPRPVRTRARQLLWTVPGGREYLFNRLPPDGARGVQTLGHRRYVGTQWDEPGRRQFRFMVGRGLRPDDVLVDVACGSLRGGVHFIPYLEPQHYLGLDKEPELLERGIDAELGRELFEHKQPQLVASDDFEFERFSKRPDLGISVSLFSHLSEVDIDHCLQKLARQARDGFRLYATFLLAESRLHRNPPRSHAHAPFRYHPDRIDEIAARNSYRAERCDDWNDPIADQAMYELQLH